MKAAFKLENPYDMEASLTVKMTVREWARLRDQLTNASAPSWQLVQVIKELVDTAEQQFNAIREPA